MSHKVLVLVIAMPLVACSSSSSTTPSNDADAGSTTDAALVVDAAADASIDVDPQARAAAESACGAEAQAMCAKLSTCYPAQLTLQYGDMATCVARLTLGCVPTVIAPGSLTTPDNVTTCAGVIATADCADLFYNRAPPSFCRTIPGSFGTGATCGFGAQCQSGVCQHNGACGVCVRRAEEAEPCTTTEDCDGNLFCAGGICIAPGDIGSHCDDAHPCESGRKCLAGTCQMPNEMGDPCAPAMPVTESNCDAPAGLWCDTTSKTCKPWGSSATGACGVVGGNLVMCSGAGACTGGTCVPPAKDGASCANAPCLPPAECISGTCDVRTESTCL